MLEVALIPPAVTLTAVLFGIWTTGRSCVEASKRRTKHLEIACAGFHTHYLALDKFLSDGRAPVILKLLTLDFSDAVSDETLSRVIVRMSLNNAPLTEPDQKEAEAVQKAMREMAETAPDLVEQFTLIARTGMVGMTFRHSDLAAEVELLLARDRDLGGKAEAVAEWARRNVAAAAPKLSMA